MARSTPATQDMVDAGLTVALTAPNVDGDIVDAGNGAFLLVNNASAGSITVTVLTPATKTYQGLDIADRAVTVAAGALKAIPVPALHKQESDAAVGPGQALVDYSAVASVTRAVVRA